MELISCHGIHGENIYGFHCRVMAALICMYDLHVTAPFMHVDFKIDMIVCIFYFFGKGRIDIA